MSEPTETRDFFTSFTGADRDWAAWIAWTIEEAGYSVWFQDWDFKGNFVLEMDRAHNRSRRTIAVLSPDYLRSRFAAPEWAARFADDATSEHDLLVPVRIADFQPEGLLKQIVYVDLVGIEEDAAKTRLLQRLSGLRRKPTEAPRFPGPTIHRVVTEKPDFPTQLATHNLAPRNPDFVGRETALDDIAAALAAPDDQPLVVTQAITGLGGIGKTQTALAFAHRQLNSCRLVWWLNAETPAKLAADYAGMARHLGIAPTADEAALNQAIRETLQARDGWLLVFDNVETRDAIRPYLPASGHGRVLLTSRRTDWQGIARSLALDVMSEPEALCLLTGTDDPSSALAPADLAEAKALVSDLGYLPLALAQARAFMRERGYGFAAYRRLFGERLVEVMARGADELDPTIDATEHADARRRQRAVTATWDISIEAAAKAAPGARELLQFLSCFAPEPLPRAVLDAENEALPETLRDAFARDDALAALVRLSLVDATDDSITTHRLVQAITHESLKRTDPQAAGARAESAVRLLLAAMPQHMPSDHRSWGHHERLLAHHLAASAQAEALEAALPSLATLLNQTALYLKARASYAEAEPLYLRAIAIGEKTLGPDHPSLATWLNNFAGLCQATGRYEEAEPLYQRGIAITEKTLGPDHPDLAISLNNLGDFFHATGRFAEAEPLYLRAMTITEKTLGPDNRNLATNLNNLAELYRDTGSYAEAEPLYRRAIAIGEKTLGLDHPDLATWLNNLALLNNATGRLAKAEPLYQRAIAIGEKSLGPVHPDLAIRLSNLAGLCQDTGRYAEAEPLHQRAITITEKALGPDHPDLAISLNNLALLYRATGRFAEAETLYRRAIAIGEKTLGPDHPDLATWLNNLAGLYRTTGRYDEAEPLYQRAIAMIEAALPADHPHRAFMLDNYAGLLEKLDLPGEAAALRARAQVVRDTRAAAGR